MNAEKRLLPSLLIFTLVAMFCLATSRAAPGAIIYHSRTAFDADVATLGLSSGTVDFDGLTPGGIVPDLSSLGGVTFDFDADGSSSGLDFFVNPAFDTTSPDHSLGVHAFPDASDNLFIDGDIWSMSFAPANAFGISFITSDPLFVDTPTDIPDITLTTDTSVVAESDDSLTPDVLADGGHVYFLGIIDSTESFTSVEVGTIGGEFFLYTVDDVTTAVIPEPSSFLVWSGLGLMGFLLLRRRGRLNPFRRFS